MKRKIKKLPENIGKSDGKLLLSNVSNRRELLIAFLKDNLRMKHFTDPEKLADLIIESNL